MSGAALIWAGLAFASWAEVAFDALMLLPLLFFAACVVYLLLLLLNAIRIRKRVVLLARPDIAGGATDTPAKNLQANTLILPIDTHSAGINAKAAENKAPEGNTAEDIARFVLLIPAHNEELLLGAALSALQQLHYPRSHYEIIVIADNCSDSTASIARNAGALALERSDKARIGKGYALEDTLQWLIADSAQSLIVNSKLNSNFNAEPTENKTVDQNIVRRGSTTLNPGTLDGDITAWNRARQFEAVVILDADTFVSSNMLSAFSEALRHGEQIVQVRYDVFNTDDSWRTRLMSCALALAHVVKPLGRERLQLSDGLKGNGMCFTRDVVVKVPWSGESITEDIEYTLRVCREGFRVAYVPEACVWAQMPVTGAQAASQRQRWEGGRYRLLFKVAPQLLLESLRTRNRLLRDRAIELIVPPFAEMFALPLALGLVCILASVLLGWHTALLFASAWGLVLALQAAYLLTGMWVARMSWRVVLSLLFAPLYIVWKLGLYIVMAVGRSAGGWKRTERHELTK